MYFKTMDFLFSQKEKLHKNLQLEYCTHIFSKGFSHFYCNAMNNGRIKKYGKKEH